MDGTDASSTCYPGTRKYLPFVGTFGNSLFIKNGGDSSYRRNDTYAFTRNSPLETLCLA